MKTVKIAWYCECGAYCKGRADADMLELHKIQRALHEAEGHRQVSPRQCQEARKKEMENLLTEVV